MTLLWKTSEDGTETAEAHGFSYQLRCLSTAGDMLQLFFLQLKWGIDWKECFDSDELYSLAQGKEVAQAHANHTASLLASKAQAALPGVG